MITFITWFHCGKKRLWFRFESGERGLKILPWKKEGERGLKILPCKTGLMASEMIWVGGWAGPLDGIPLPSSCPEGSDFSWEGGGVAVGRGCCGPRLEPRWVGCVMCARQMVEMLEMSSTGGAVMLCHVTYYSLSNESCMKRVGLKK